MYKVLPDRGGYSVFWVESPAADPVLVPRATDDPDEKFKPYPQRQAAYRRSKKLNDLASFFGEMIAREMVRPYARR